MFRYDPHGLHFAELARLAMVAPMMFEIVRLLINLGFDRMALKISQKFI